MAELTLEQSEVIQGAVERAMSFGRKADGAAMTDADYLALWHAVKGEGPSTSKYLVEKK